jgi:hypothetical protein
MKFPHLFGKLYLLPNGSALIGIAMARIPKDSGKVYVKDGLLLVASSNLAWPAILISRISEDVYSPADSISTPF